MLSKFILKLKNEHSLQFVLPIDNIISEILIQISTFNLVEELSVVHFFAVEFGNSENQYSKSFSRSPAEEYNVFLLFKRF
jgi:hypothetical protein